MKRSLSLLVLVVAALGSAPAHAVETVSATGLVWDQQGSLSLPLPATHQAWPDEVVAMTGDGQRLHALWKSMPGRPGIQYRWSTDAINWSTPERVGEDQDAITVTTDGTVFALGPSSTLARRSPAGAWTSSLTPHSSLTKLVMQTAPDGRVWIAYSNTLPGGIRAVFASVMDPATSTWSTAEDTGLRLKSDEFGFGLPSISMSLGLDSTPWIALNQTANTVAVAHRGASGWVQEQVAGGSLATVNGLAIGARADGTVALVYWDRTTAVAWTLQWALRDGGSWQTKGPLHNRTSRWSVHAAMTRTPNGDLIAMWEECNRPGSWGWCFPVTSRLRVDGTWTAARPVGTFPRMTRFRYSMAVGPNGLGVLAVDGPDGFTDANAWIASERPDGTWTDQRALAPSATVEGAPDAGSIQVAAGTNDSLMVVWRQQTADGLGFADQVRTPHIALAIRSRLGGWSAAERVDDGMSWRPWYPYSLSQYDVEPDVVGIETNTAGTTYVIWREVYADSDMTIHSKLLGRMRASDGSWSSVEQLPASWTVPSSGEHQALMSFDDAGRLWVLDPYGGTYMRSTAGTWTTHPSVLPGATLRISGLRLVVSADGTQYAQYSAGFEGTNVFLVSRGVTGDWSTPERVDDGTPKYRTSGGLTTVGSVLISGFAEEVSAGVSRGIVRYRPISSSTWTTVGGTASIGGLEVADLDVTDDGSWWLAFQTCARKDDGATSCESSRGRASMHVMRRTSDARWEPAVYVSAPAAAQPEGISSLRLVGRHVPVATWGYIGNHANPLRLGPQRRVIARAVPDAQLALDVDRVSARAGECINATVRVSDADGNPLSGLEVAWILSPNAGSGGGITYNGRSDRVICWTRTGPMTVKILLTQGVATVSRSLTWSANDPAQLVATGPANPVVGTQRSVSVAVTDAYGNPASAPITWTLVDGPGVIKSSDASTGADGRAAAVLWSTQTGETTLDIAVSGTDVRGRVTFVWQPGPAFSLRFIQEEMHAQAGTPQELRAQIVDAFGNDAIGPYARVSWSSTGEGIMIGIPVTTGGSVTFARGSSITAGDTTVTVTLASTGNSATARIHWT